jgi:hypothetical protein
MRLNLIHSRSHLSSLDNQDIDELLKCIAPLRIRSALKTAIKRQLMTSVIPGAKRRRGLCESFYDLMSSEYIVEHWMNNDSPEDLRNDIEMINTNVALVAALIMSMTTPLYVGVKEVSIDNPVYENIYAGALGGCTILEAITVLLSIFNLVTIRSVLTISSWLCYLKCLKYLVSPFLVLLTYRRLLIVI